MYLLGVKKRGLVLLKARTHGATLRATICWLFPIKQDIAKLAKPKTGKYVEEELWFLVFSFRNTMKLVARNVLQK